MKRPRTVDELYANGAKFPNGKYSCQEPTPMPRGHMPKPAASLQRPQAPEDQHGPAYNNDVGRAWTRGFDGSSKIESAAGKPNFEKASDWASGKLHLREGDRRGQTRTKGNG